MTSVPGIDHPEVQTEAQVSLTGRGISVSSRVEVVQNDTSRCGPRWATSSSRSSSAWATRRAVLADRGRQRALPAEVTAVEQGPVAALAAAATGPAEVSQRRKAVRGRVMVPVVAGRLSSSRARPST